MGFDRFQHELGLMLSLIEEFICWSAQHSGSVEHLFPEQKPSSLDGTLPTELHVRHTAMPGERGQRSGFTGVNIQHSPEEEGVKAEGSVAAKSS